MQQFEQNQESNLPELTKEQERALKKSFRKGLRRGVIATAVVCVVAFACIIGISQNGLEKTTVAVTVTEDGQQHQEVLEYDTLLDRATIQKINYIAAVLQSSYYEDVDREDLVDGLFQGLFNSLDIYSQYYTQEEYDELYNMEITGSYCGIGATLTQNMNTMIVQVVNVQEGSPAEEAGIQEGDILVSADEYDATTMELSEFVSHVKGEEGTTVSIKVYRETTGEYYTYEITRRPLDVITVESEMLKDNTGYIQVTEFGGKTSDQFHDALEELKEEGMESVIIDLRSNPGGNLSTVTEMLDMILSEGMIVYTEDKYGNRQEYLATDEESLDLPLVVLIDANSASASEIFAGAIKDHQVGTLVGTTTYGKGIVQGVQPLSDGSALKLTTSTYYTPSGTCIHGTGITPDIELEYEFLGGEDDTYEYQYDNQIQKALEVLNSSAK